MSYVLALPSTYAQKAQLKGSMNYIFLIGVTKPEYLTSVHGKEA